MVHETTATKCCCVKDTMVKICDSVGPEATRSIYIVIISEMVRRARCGVWRMWQVFRGISRVRNIACFGEVRTIGLKEVVTGRGLE